MLIDSNIKGYEIIIKIEVGLREFIIKSFNDSFQQINWFSTEYNIISSKKIEHAQLMRQISIEKGWDSKSAEGTHGLYFLLLTDLKEILLKRYEREKQALNVFDINRNQIEAICSGLQSIFPIRNKIAHSVYISDFELHVLQSFHKTLENIIPEFDSLIVRPQLRKELDMNLRNALRRVCTEILSLNFVIKEDIDLLKKHQDFFQTESRQKIYSIIEKYVKLSSMNGSHVLLRNLVEDSVLNLKEIIENE
jgi:hypothetical protein